MGQEGRRSLILRDAFTRAQSTFHSLLSIFRIAQIPRQKDHEVLREVVPDFTKLQGIEAWDSPSRIRHSSFEEIGAVGGSWME